MQTFEKLKAIRKAEGLTQAKFSEISGIALGTVKNYESGHKDLVSASLCESQIRLYLKNIRSG